MLTDEDKNEKVQEDEGTDIISTQIEGDANINIVEVEEVGDVTSNSNTNSNTTTNNNTNTFTVVVNPADSSSDEDDNGKSFGGMDCPSCGSTPSPEEIEPTGRIECSNCGAVYFEWRPNNNITEFKSIAPGEESERYKNILFRISSFITLEKYAEAMDKCLELIEIAPREAFGYEYQALCHFLKNTNNSIIQEDAKTIKNYLKVAKDANADSSTYEGIVKRIAYGLYYPILHRINKIYYIINEEGDIDWRDNDRLKLESYIKAIKSCYAIYPDAQFLERAVKELGIINRLIVEKEENKISNTARTFNAIKERKAMIEIIKNANPDYEEPPFEKLRKSITLNEHDLLSEDDSFSFLKRGGNQ